MRNVASGFVVESVGVNVVALARMLLGEGAQHHQSLFTSRIAVPIVVVQVVARRSNKNLPSPQNAKPLKTSKLLAPGTGVGAPTCGCLANHGQNNQWKVWMRSTTCEYTVG